MQGRRQDACTWREPAVDRSSADAFADDLEEAVAADKIPQR
jgi:hypothetical protein